MRPDEDTFRAALGRFATGVTVVATTVDGVDHAMTANALTSVSLDPLLLLVCVEKEARFHDAVQAAGVWAVSVLADGQQPAAEWLATRGRPLPGQLDQVPHGRSPLGLPVLAGALAWLECRTTAAYDGGDHTVVLGAPTAIEVAGNPAAGPLLWYRGRYRRLPDFLPSPAARP